MYTWFAYSGNIGFWLRSSNLNISSVDVLLKETAGYFVQNGSSLISSSENEVELISGKSLVGSEFKLYITFDVYESLYWVKYRFSLVEIFRLSIFVFLIAVFIGYFMMKALLFPLLILTALFFIVNVFYINTTIRKLLMDVPFLASKDFVVLEDQVVRSLLSESSTICLNCQANLGKYDFECPKCQVVKPSTGIWRANIAKYQDKQFKYLFKEKSKKG